MIINNNFFKINILDNANLWLYWQKSFVISIYQLINNHGNNFVPNLVYIVANVLNKYLTNYILIIYLFIYLISLKTIKYNMNF